MPPVVNTTSDSPLRPYRSTEARDHELDRLANALGGEVQVFGASREGRALRVARIPGSGRTTRPLLVCAGIHGLEFIGCEVALGWLAAMAAGAYGDLREEAEIWVIASLNPDGYERTWAADGRGVLEGFRRNAGGVDLNRNFPLPGPQRPVLSTFGGWRTGSTDPANSFYRGPSPLSEPEAAALDALLHRVPFVASANLHATMGTLITPCIGDAASASGYRTLCAAFARAQLHTRYRRVSGGWFDRYTGEQEDHQHHAHRTWAICVEHYPLWVDSARFLSSELFWRFNPRDPTHWIANDVPGLAAYFRAALAMTPRR
jgi:hypothetical protein